MDLPDFKYHRPDTVENACGLLDELDYPGLLAGGTDLLVEMKLGKRSHKDIISLSGIDELKSIELNDNKILIGACATHNDILNSPLVKVNIPALCDTARNIATEQIRNTATVGGNLCTAASCCDMAPVLMALDAVIETGSVNGFRSIPVREFFTDHRRTELKRNELLRGIIIDIPPDSTSVSFKKHGLRNAASIAVASVACMIRTEKGIIKDAAVVLGAVAPTPKMSNKAAELLIGKKNEEVNEVLLDSIGDAAASEAAPIDDIRGTAVYRKELVKVLTIRALRELADKKGEK